MTDTPPTPPADDAVDMGLLGDALGFLLKRAQMAVFADFIGAFAAEDIRPAQFSVLVVIDRNPGLKQSQVSNVLSIKRTNFVPLLDSLEARGLVKRKPAAGDRRSYALHLTPKGRALTARLTALWEQHEARVRERLGEEGRARLFELLGRLVDLGTPGGGDDADGDTPPPKPRSARRKPQRAVKPDNLAV